MILHVPLPAQRLHKHQAEVEVAALLRDPVRRAYSAYWWARVTGFERLAGFDEALRADPARSDTAMVRANRDYLANSCYNDSISELFDRDRVHNFFDDDIRERPVEVCRELFAGVGIERDQAIDTDRRAILAEQPRSERLARLLRRPPQPLKHAANLVLPRSAVRRVYRHLAEANRREFTLLRSTPRRRPNCVKTPALTTSGLHRCSIARGRGYRTLSNHQQPR